MNLYATCCEPAASSLAVTHYPPIASRDQVVKLLPQQGLLLRRTQIMPTGTLNQIQKAKQPQILPKPIPQGSSPQKQTVPRLNPVMPQQTPLLINQPQAQNPTLLLNQVLTSGAPVIVQPAGPGGTVHLMLRTPTPTLQSGPGPPGNKMIITNTTQPQPQATVLIQNRQQVVRFMTAQGPMQVQQIQTPSGPQLIAIPQNQSLSFPPNSVLVQGPAANALQLQQNSGNAIQLRQSPSAILQANSFPPNSLPNQIFQANAATSVGLKLDEKPGSTDLPSSLPGTNDQKKFVIDNKASSKKTSNTLNSTSNFNSGNNNTNVNNLNNNLLNNIKKTAKINKKAEDEMNRSGKTITKDNSTPAPTPQKNVTSTLRQVRPGAFVNRKNQNVEKSEDKSLSNLAKIIDSVASNTEHLSSPPSPKIDNLTATINSVAENIKSPTHDDIMNINLNDVFISENKSLNLNKRPNLTIVQKQKPEPEEPMGINRLMLSPNSSMDFENITKNYDSMELSAITSSAGVQTTEPNFSLEQNTQNQGAFQNQEEGKKGKKKATTKKKGKKEESRVNLWDLMKSAGIGDEEFDDPAYVNLFSQDTATTITEPIEISASDTDLLAQLQTASQVPGGIRVVVGEDGRPIIINGGNVLIPDSVTNTAAACSGEAGDSEAVLQNMIVPDNVINFTPQAFATAQTQLNQLIQDHGGIATSSADQQLLSQIFGATPSSIGNTCATATTCTNTSMTQSTNTPSLPSVQNQSFPSSGDVLVNMAPNSEVDQQPVVTPKPEQKPEFIGGPPPGLPPLGPDSLVITNNNGVPTLVASPALMQYLQTHQGVIQFQHDPVTKTIQPSLIIPHPQHKLDLPSNQDGRTDKATIVASIRPPLSQNKELTKPRIETKGCVGTITDDNKNSMTVINSLVPNVIKQNMVKFVKDNPPLLQIATETNNLINFKEVNKNLSDKERVEIDKKIQQNRAILDQCFLMESNRVGALPGSGRVQNVVLKETGGDKVGVCKTSAETQTLEDLQNLDMTLIKGFHPPANTNSPNPNSDFQAKFLESIGMGNKTSKATVNVVTSAPVTTQSAIAKKSRKKKDKNQATQADMKTEAPNLTFNIAELTPEQNLKLNQALQSRGAIVNQIDNLEAIKQIIQEEVRKMTSNPVQSANIRFTSAEDKEDQSAAATNVLFSNANLNQLLEPGGSQGNVISLQGNELVAINNGNQQLFASQNQILSGNHFVPSNNQILAIGGNPNQLVSLGNPMGSSNPIVALGSPPNVVSMGGNNIASQGAVIVGNNGNVVAIVHQNPNSGQGPGLVQRVQAIQLTTPKQQHFKSIQSQIQSLTSKTTRTAAEQATLQKLILEQQKLLATAKIVPTVSGQIQGMQIVSESIANPGRVIQAQTLSQQQQSSVTQTVNQTQQSLQQQQPQTLIINNNNNNNNNVNNNNINNNSNSNRINNNNNNSNNNNGSSNTLNSQSFKGNWTAGAQSISCGTNTSDLTSTPHNIPKLSVPPTVLISDSPTGNYGPLYVSPNNSNKNVTKCEKGTSPIQIQMGTQTVTNMEYRSGKMSTGTMTSPNTGKPQAVVAPAIVIQQTESQSPTYQMKPRSQTTANEPLRPQVPTISRTAFIEQQMRTDQGGATMPDTRTPFLSKSDAVKRLIRYHVMDEKALSAQDLATADEIFEATAQHLLDKFRAMKEKYKYLLMLESMREVSTAERIMVDRNFIIEERLELEELREKEKRLQEAFENPTITYSSCDSSIIKTEVGEVKAEIKTEVSDLMEPEDIKKEAENGGSGQMISKNRNSDINSDLFKDSAFKVTEANRNVDLTKIKSETKECKNTRTHFGSPGEEEYPNISAKCKVKTSRTFSDGSSKSSLDSSKDEDSGTDINAQVQSAIDSILNLRLPSESTEDGGPTKRSKKKRKHWDKCLEGTKRSKTKGFGKGQEEEEERGLSPETEEEEEEEEEEEKDGEGGDSDAERILNQAIMSIMMS